MKINYDLKLKEELEKIGNTRPKLLLHVCCGPCSSNVIKELCEYFDMTLYYSNSNIYPNEEYKDEQGITDCKEALQQIIDQVNQKVPSYKHIHTLKIRNTAFEKTTSKKIKRNKL